MNIYKVWQDENTGYDTYDGYIAIAETEEAAKNLMPLSQESWGPWASHAENVHARLIGIAATNEEEIVLDSFNAG